METEEACNVCDGTSFTINAGFYYCDTCGTQAAQKQEVEDLDDGGFAAFEDRTHQSKHKIKKATKIEGMLVWILLFCHIHLVYIYVDYIVCAMLTL